MAKPLSEDTRRALVDGAAKMLARRQTVTARSLAEAAGTSTIALYTYFGGMDGLWGAVRQEGFVRLGKLLEKITPTKDPVADMARYGVAYVDNALAHPHLYRTMFDAAFALPSPEVAASGFAVLVEAAERARVAGRFVWPAQETATRLWAIGHGLASLVGSGVMDEASMRKTHAAEMTIALFIAAGDEPKRCRRSVLLAWA